MYSIFCCGKIAFALCSLAAVAQAAPSVRGTSFSAQGARLASSSPQWSGLGSYFSMQAPPHLTDFQTGPLVALTYNNSKEHDLRGLTVPDQAVLSQGSGLTGTAEVSTSFDTATYSSSFGKRIGGTVNFKYVSGGASYSKFSQRVSSSLQAAYESSVSLSMSLQHVRLAQPERVQFVEEAEFALQRLNATFALNGTADPQPFYRFFHLYNAHFVSEYTYGGYADFRVVSTTDTYSHFSSTAKQLGGSVGLAFAGVGISISGGTNASEADYNQMMKQSTSISVHCEGGDSAQCATSLDIPPYGTAKPPTNPVATWAKSVSPNSDTLSMFATDVTSISRVLRFRGMYQFADAFDSMYTKYVLMCPTDKDRVSICAGHGACIIEGTTAKCSCFTSPQGISYVGDTCSCPGTQEAGPCSGKGTCSFGSESTSDPNGPGVCECDEGFTGPACNQKKCPIDPFFSNLGQCGGHGECQTTGKCSCQPGWRGPACTVPCGDQGKWDLFQIPVDPASPASTWGEVVKGQQVEMRADCSSETSCVDATFGIASSKPAPNDDDDHNGAGEIFFYIVDPSAGEAGLKNAHDDYGWLYPTFYHGIDSNFPPDGWPRNTNTPGDAICQFVFNTWLKEAFGTSAPDITKMSVFSSRLQRPKLVRSIGETDNYFSAFQQGSYVDTLDYNKYFSNQTVHRSVPAYLWQLSLGHYPADVFCHTMCPNEES